MKSCPTCHRHTDDLLSFCSRDGSVLVAGDRRCRACLRCFPATFRFCVFDGESLSGTAPAARAFRPSRLLLSAAASVLFFLAGAHLGGAFAPPASAPEPPLRVRVDSNSKPAPDAPAYRPGYAQALPAPLALTPGAVEGSRK